MQPFRQAVDHPPATQQVWGQVVDWFQHGQAAQGGLDAPGRDGPGRVLVAGADDDGFILYRTRSGEGGSALALQVRRMVVVQGEAILEVRQQLALGVELGQPLGAGLLPGTGMLMAGDVQKRPPLFRVRNQRCWRLSVMPRTTDSIQPSL